MWSCEMQIFLTSSQYRPIACYARQYIHLLWVYLTIGGFMFPNLHMPPKVLVIAFTVASKKFMAEVC